MHLASAKTIKSLCNHYHFWPSRSSGQNFLIHQKSLQKIIEAARLTSQDIVLEIGAGFGTLTFALAGRVKKVIAVELDMRLAAAVADRIKQEAIENVEMVPGDIFQQWPKMAKQLRDLSYKIVSNLPYNITSLVLRSFLEGAPRPAEMTVLVQKEVAERVTAKPGAMSVLSVACQFYGEPSMASIIPREHFWPEPEVDSAILRIEAIGKDRQGYQKALGSLGVDDFFRVVKFGFSARRKQLHNNLAAGLRVPNSTSKQWLKKVGLNENVRAQNISVEQWIQLAKALIETKV